jgi:hypothetical protein
MRIPIIAVPALILALGVACGAVPEEEQNAGGTATTTAPAETAAENTS